jgi:hypothetical protein
MAENVKFETTPIVLELLPAVIQVTGIAAFLYVARQEIIYTFGAIFLSLIWLKVSEQKWVQEFGKMRVTRRLFGKMGEWLSQEDAEEVFDDALAEYLMIDRNVDSDDNIAVVTAAGLANTLRGAAYVLVSVYLVFVVFTVFTSV